MSTVKALNRGQPPFKRCSPIPSACCIAYSRSRCEVETVCLPSTCDAQLLLLFEAVRGSSNSGSVDHCACGAQLHELLNMVKLLAKRYSNFWASKLHKEIQVTNFLTLSLSWPSSFKAKIVAREAQAVSHGCLPLTLLCQWKSETACAHKRCA